MANESDALDAQLNIDYESSDKHTKEDLAKFSERASKLTPERQKYWAERLKLDYGFVAVKKVEAPAAAKPAATPSK